MAQSKNKVTKTNLKNEKEENTKGELLYFTLVGTLVSTELPLSGYFVKKGMCCNNKDGPVSPEDTSKNTDKLVTKEESLYLDKNEHAAEDQLFNKADRIMSSNSLSSNSSQSFFGSSNSFSSISNSSIAKTSYSSIPDHKWMDYEEEKEKDIAYLNKDSEADKVRDEYGNVKVLSKSNFVKIDKIEVRYYNKIKDFTACKNYKSHFVQSDTTIIEHIPVNMFTFESLFTGKTVAKFVVLESNKNYRYTRTRFKEKFLKINNSRDLNSSKTNRKLQKSQQKSNPSYNWKKKKINKIKKTKIKKTKIKKIHHRHKNQLLKSKNKHSKLSQLKPKSWGSSQDNKDDLNIRIPENSTAIHEFNNKPSHSPIIVNSNAIVNTDAKLKTTNNHYYNVAKQVYELDIYYIILKDYACYIPSRFTNKNVVSCIALKYFNQILKSYKIKNQIMPENKNETILRNGIAVDSLNKVYWTDSIKMSTSENATQLKKMSESLTHTLTYRLFRNQKGSMKQVEFWTVLPDNSKTISNPNELYTDVMYNYFPFPKYNFYELTSTQDVVLTYRNVAVAGKGKSSEYQCMIDSYISRNEIRCYEQSMVPDYEIEYQVDGESNRIGIAIEKDWMMDEHNKHKHKTWFVDRLDSSYKIMRYSSHLD